eukprot:TRINITY_DN10197_c0_g2_i1.p1 TRINITY_DN10197_c0_g2~~TRINITY_DN10197_c0_g2_i1.p1  ORF type:complete len:1254 (+),score=275.77 TRINITY_DN10197_c0_g2_i1:61-3762(+)
MQRRASSCSDTSSSSEGSISSFRAGDKRKRSAESIEMSIDSCSDEPECGMQCFACLPDGESMPIIIDAEDTLRTLRGRVKKAWSELNGGKHFLMYKGRVLKDLDESVSEIGLEPESTIDIGFSPKFLARDALKNRYKLEMSNVTLFTAIKKNDLDLVKTLIVAGVDPSVATDCCSEYDGMSEAEEAGDEDVSLPSFALAASLGRLDILKYLFSTQDPCEEDYTTSVSEALRAGYVKSCLYLLSLPNQLCPDILSHYNHKASYYQTSDAKRKEYRKLMPVLLKKANVNFKKKTESNTVLRMVIESGADVQTVQYIVSLGADIKDVNEDGENILSCNITNRSMVDYLLQQGAVPCQAAVEAFASNELISPDFLRTLISMGADVCNVHVYHAAARAQDLESLAFLIEEAGVDVNMADEDQETALHAIARSDYDEDPLGPENRAVDYLISKGISIMHKSWTCETALDDAITQANYPVVRQLLKKLPASEKPVTLNVQEWPCDTVWYEFVRDNFDDINTATFDREGRSLLAALVDAGSADDDDIERRLQLLGELIKMGISPNMVSPVPFAASNVTTEASSYIENSRYLQCLMEHGGNPNLARANKVTALHSSCGESITRFFLSLKEVDPNTPDWKGMTPLHSHVMRAHGRGHYVKLAKKLRKDIEWNARDVFGNTPVFYARSLEVLKELIKAGADPKVTNELGMSLLTWAMDMPMVHYLVDEMGLDPHHKDKHGMTVLMHFLRRSVLLEMIDEFIAQYEPDLRAADADGNTVAMFFMQRYPCAEWETRFSGKKAAAYELETTRNNKGETAYHLIGPWRPRPSPAVERVLLDSKVTDNNGLTPLMRYVALPNAKWIPGIKEHLHEVCPDTGKSILMHLLLNGNHENHIDFSDPKIDLSAADKQGKTLLMHIASEITPLPKSVSARVTEADLRMQDKGGKTVTMHAVDLVEFLEEPFSSKLDLSIVDNEGNNIVHLNWGIQSRRILSNKDLWSARNNMGVAAWMKLDPKDPQTKDKVPKDVSKEDRFLAYKVRTGETGLPWVMDKVSVKDTDNDGKTLLHHACINNNGDDVKVLLQAGSDADAKDKLGRTALFYANDDDVLRMLKRQGADCSITDSFGCTALDQQQFVSDVDYFEAFMQLYPDAPRGNPSYAAHHCIVPLIYATILPFGVEHEYIPPAESVTQQNGASNPEETMLIKFFKVRAGAVQPPDFHYTTLDYFYKYKKLTTKSILLRLGRRRFL